MARARLIHPSGPKDEAVAGLSLHPRIPSAQARQLVFPRDRGVCALCRLDTERIRRVAKALFDRRKMRLLVMLGERLFAWHRRAVRWSRPYSGCDDCFTVRALWEADHIVAIYEGGSNDLDNLRTLCLKCHARETGLLRRRLNARRAS